MIFKRQRLEMILPFEATWAQALGVLALPYNIPVAAGLLHASSDEILFVCGDESTDFSWYTKRALISTLYAASELHMLSDQSPLKADTWSFLERRLDDYASCIQTFSQVTKFF
jgi:ubiquinone biosynthesis protein COQ9